MRSTSPEGLPSGTVTFLFTDVEGSTKLLHEAPEAYRRAVTRHHEILADAVTGSGGCVFETVGDAVYAAFGQVESAVHAAVEAQRCLAAEPWGETPIHVRMAIHSGDVDLQGDHYFGPALYRAARLMSAAHGDQVLVSQASAAMLRDRRPRDLDLLDLGEHRLKDMPGPERIYQLAATGLRRDFSALRTLAGRRDDLPVVPTRLIGRDRELESARRMLSTGRILTVTGPGGVGKTRLALELAGDASEEHPDGVFFVPLARISDPDLVTNAIAQAIGVREIPGRPLIHTLLDHIRHLRILLVLDNFEHLLAAAPIVSELLATGPELRVMTTSQAPLRIQGEQELLLQPLPQVSVDEGVPEVGPAMLLFLERAREIRPDLRPSPSDLRAISEICARLDGLPLAIELAAARIRLLTPVQLLGRLDRALPILTAGARDLPDRQRTMRQAIEWSHGLLDERDRIAFRRCAVLNGPCEIADAEEILTSGRDIDRFGSLDALGSLVEKSLLRREGDRVSMLAVIREYAGERLASAGEQDTWGRAHAEHFAKLAELSAPLLLGPQQLNALGQIDAAMDQIRGAFGWAAEHDKALGVRLAASLSMYWFMRARLTEALHWYRALMPVDQVATGKEGYVLAWASFVNADKGDPQSALALMRQAEARLPEATDIGDKVQGEAWCAYVRILEDPQAALLAARRIASDRLGRHGTWLDGWVSLLVGELERFQGDDDAAFASYERSIDAFREVGDRFLLALELVNIAHLYLRRGQIDVAERCVWEAIEAFRAFGNTWTLAYAAIALAGVALARGQALDAVGLLGAASAWFGQNGLEMQAPDRREYEKYLAVANAAVTEERFASAWAAGSRLSIDDALETMRSPAVAARAS